MLKLLLLLSFVGAAAPSSRARSKQILESACLRSEVHTNADQRRKICACIVDRMSSNNDLSDGNFEYLAKAWAEPYKKITPRPGEADILEDYDEDLMESCIEAALPKAKKQTKGKP